jgi:hypothetical protein
MLPDALRHGRDVGFEVCDVREHGARTGSERMLQTPPRFSSRRDFDSRYLLG